MDSYAKKRERRAVESKEEKRERLNKRNEKDRAKRAAESEAVKKERLRKRREKDRARRIAIKVQKEMVESNDRMQQTVSTSREACLLESQDPVMPIPHARKSQFTDQSTAPALLQQKRQRLATEEEDRRTSSLEQPRAYQSEVMEVETQGEREARVERMSHLRKVAQEESQARILWGGHLPLLEQHHVQATMRAFHQDMATIESPVCATCMEKFPGLKVNARTSECLRCARDKHVPKLFSADNNMHPGVVPSQLQVSYFICNVINRIQSICFHKRVYHRQRKCSSRRSCHSCQSTAFLMDSTATGVTSSTCHRTSLHLLAAFPDFLLN